MIRLSLVGAFMLALAASSLPAQTSRSSAASSPARGTAVQPAAGLAATSAKPTGVRSASSASRTTATRGTSAPRTAASRTGAARSTTTRPTASRSTTTRSSTARATGTRTSAGGRTLPKPAAVLSNRPARSPLAATGRAAAADHGRATAAPAVEIPALSAALPAALAVATGAAGTPAARPSGPAGRPPSVAELRDSIVAMARAQLGTRYVLGGTTPDRGFDCSGLIRYIAQALKLDVPRTADEQARVGQPVALDPGRLRPGDLLTFGTGRRVSHIGIYIGDGKFIHASTGSRRVVEARIDRKPALGIKPWIGVRRLLADADSARGE